MKIYGIFFPWKLYVFVNSPWKKIFLSEWHLCALIFFKCIASNPNLFLPPQIFSCSPNKTNLDGVNIWLFMKKRILKKKNQISKKQCFLLWNYDCVNRYMWFEQFWTWKKNNFFFGKKVFLLSISPYLFFLQILL